MCAIFVVPCYLNSIYCALYHRGLSYVIEAFYCIVQRSSHWTKRKVRLMTKDWAGGWNTNCYFQHPPCDYFNHIRLDLNMFRVRVYHCACTTYCPLLFLAENKRIMNSLLNQLKSLLIPHSRIISSFILWRLFTLLIDINFRYNKVNE